MLKKSPGKHQSINLGAGVVVPQSLGYGLLKDMIEDKNFCLPEEEKESDSRCGSERNKVKSKFNEDNSNTLHPYR